MFKLDWQTVEKTTIIGALAAQLYVFIKWVHKRFHAYKRTEEFVFQMHSNHLPHIYKTLGNICSKLEIPFEEPEDKKDNG